MRHLTLVMAFLAMILPSSAFAGPCQTNAPTPTVHPEKSSPQNRAFVGMWAGGQQMRDVGAGSLLPWGPTCVAFVINPEGTATAKVSAFWGSDFTYGNMIPADHADRVGNIEGNSLSFQTRWFDYRLTLIDENTMQLWKTYRPTGHLFQVTLKRASGGTQQTELPH